MINWPLVRERGLRVFKFMLAALMIFAGIATAVAAPDSTGEFGWLFSSREILITYGIIFGGSGLTLLYGLIVRSRKWVGNGLMYIYLCFVFAALLNAISLGFGDLGAWVPNILCSVIVGGLYLRWRFKTQYVDPKHFVRDVNYLQPKDRPYECN